MRQPAQKANVIAGKRMGSKRKVVAVEREQQVAEKPKLERVKLNFRDKLIYKCTYFYI